MKDKLIKVLSPITVFVIGLFDIATICYGVVAIKKIIAERSTITIVFLFLEILAIIIAAIVTKQIFSDGVKFSDDEFEFTALDDNSIYSYDDVIDIQCEKDESTSFVKNFIDRHSILNISLKDGKEISIDLGLTTKYTLELVAKEICSRANIEMKPTNTHKRVKKTHNAEETSLNDNNSENTNINEKEQ